MPVQQRAIVTREKILTSAAKIFAETNYADAAMSDITREAGVTQGSVYFHFGSKGGLANAILLRQHELSAEIGDRHLAQPQPACESITAFLNELATALTTDPIMRGGLRLAIDPATSSANPETAPYEEWLEFIEQLLERAVKDKILAENDVKPVARGVLSSFIGVYSLATEFDEIETIPESISFLVSRLIPSVALQCD